MKPFLFLSLSAILMAALSCTKAESPAPLPEPSPVPEVPCETGTLYVSLETTATKASLSEQDEKAVRCLQVFVFNAESGKRETDKFVSGDNLSITSPVGQKHVWAIVNHDRFADITTEDELKGTVTDLADNYTSASGIRLIMAGEKDVEVTQSNMQVSINVTRLAARIALSRVTRKFADTYLAAASFTIKDIYLKNVAGNTWFSLDKKNSGTEWDLPDPDLWYNQLRNSNTASVSPLLGDHNLNIVCEEATAKNIGRVWFTYPNPTSGDSNTSPFCARHTRLVVHAEVTGYGAGAIQTYYTFTLPTLKRNASYEISDITFTMLGKDNDDDDSVTDTGTASITLNVLSWDTAEALTFNR